MNEPNPKSTSGQDALTAACAQEHAEKAQQLSSVKKPTTQIDINHCQRRDGGGLRYLFRAPEPDRDGDQIVGQVLDGESWVWSFWTSCGEEYERSSKNQFDLIPTPERMPFDITRPCHMRYGLKVERLERRDDGTLTGIVSGERRYWFCNGILNDNGTESRYDLVYDEPKAGTARLEINPEWISSAISTEDQNENMVAILEMFRREIKRLDEKIENLEKL